MLCTLRHRCRQRPQRSSRLPSRSIWMTIYPLVSSAVVTVCAFNPSCFLINVSMSTSIFLSRDVNSIPPKDWMFSGFTPSRPPRQHAAFKTLQLQLHFLGQQPVKGTGNTEPQMHTDNRG